MATLQIGGEAIAEWAPGNLVVSVGNGTPNAPLTISVDGAATGQDAVLDPSGALANLTVVLFSHYSVGSHDLTLTTPDDTGSVSITVQKNAPVPVAVATPPAPSEPVTPGRWQFEDPVLHEVYVLPISPSSEGVPFAGRTLSEKVTTTGHPLTSEGTEHSATWPLEGYIATQEQYDAFVHWASKPYRLYFTDDLGRQFVGIILDFAPVPFDPQHTEDNFVRSHFGMSIEVLGQVT